MKLIVGHKTKFAIRLVFLLIFLVWTIFPFFWMISMSLKEKTDILAMPPKWIFNPSTKSYSEALNKEDFVRSFFNSTSIGLLSTLLALLIGIPAAYILSRFKFKGSSNIESWILSTRMMPPIVIIIPYFLLFSSLRMLDTKLAVIIVHTLSGLPLVIWFMRGFFVEIPNTIEEAAMIDGCSYFGAFLKIIIPLTVPGVVSVGILTFLFSWNEFLMSLVLTSSKSKTAPVLINNFVSFQEIAWGPLTAAGVLILIPVIIFVLIGQKGLIRGMTFGAVKE